MQSARCVALAVLLFAAAPAYARDMTGKGGVGLLITTEGMPMATFRYWRSSVALEALVGYVSTTPATARVSHPDVTQLRIALGLLYKLGDASRASLSLGLRPWLQYTLSTYSIFLRPSGQAADEVEDSNWRFGAEIPLQGEVFLNDHFSLIGHVGLTMDIGPPISRSDGAATALDLQKDTTFLIGVRGGFAGGAGATYYF